MRLRILLLSFFCFLSLVAESMTSENNRALLDSLIREKDVFEVRIHSRQLFLDSVRARREQLAPSPERVALTRSLGDVYIRQDVDSALTYWNLAISEAEALGLETEAFAMRMRVISALPRAGVLLEAFEEFSKIDPSVLSSDLRQEYWRNAAELYYYTQQPYPEGKYKAYYVDKTIAALDSLQQYYPVGSPSRRYLVAQIHLFHKEESLAAADFMDLLPELGKHPDFYQFALWSVANYYKDREDYKDLYLNYMLRLCISTMRDGLPSPRVMALTGRLLVDAGQSRVGNSLIEEALSISDMTSGPYHTFDRSVYTSHLSSNSRRTVYLLSGVIIALVVSLVMCFFMLRRRRDINRTLVQRLDVANGQYALLLDEMKKVNASVLSLAFLSTTQLRDFNLYVVRKLKANQAADLANEVCGGGYMQAFMEKFYTSFDDTFLTSFPGFLDRLNQLFIPERRLSLLPGNRMTPELRIAAMIRIGITESARLSQALGLSINTIYTYRNRLKGRATDRQNFDKNLQELPFLG